MYMYSITYTYKHICIYVCILYINIKQKIFLFFIVSMGSFLSNNVLRTYFFVIIVNYISRTCLNILIKFTLWESDINLHNGRSLNILYFIIHILHIIPFYFSRLLEY